MKDGSRGYAPRASSLYQDALLDRMISYAREETVGVFDLDGCLFDTRTRQVAIFREFAAQYQIFELLMVREEHFIDWSLQNTLKNIGLSATRIAEIVPLLEEFWFPRFFGSRYASKDPAMPGAVALVQACHQRGMTIVYLTGRHHEMRAGTIEALLAYGFPYDPPKAQLITKPALRMDDTEYKSHALAQISQLGQPTLFIDNEPSNVNAFFRAFPDALTVFIESDHSPKPDRPAVEIPWIRSFYRSSWPNAYIENPLHVVE